MALFLPFYGNEFLYCCIYTRKFKGFFQIQVVFYLLLLEFRF